MSKPTAPTAPVTSPNVVKGSFLGYQEFNGSNNKTTVFEVYVTDTGAVVNSLASDEVLNEGDRRTLVRTVRDGKQYWNAVLPTKPKHVASVTTGLDHV